MKHKYDLSELRFVGIDDIVPLLQKAESLPKVDDDELKAEQIVCYILENSVCSLRAILPYVMENHLWSAWRRGQSTFIQLIKENEKFTLEKQYKSYTHNDPFNDLYSSV